MAPSDLQRVLDGRTWSDFCDALKQAGQVILRPETPSSELDRAEGWRYLSRLVRIALETQLEHADPEFPVFYAICHPTAKMGADNPDNNYRTAVVRGDCTYRIRGTRGSAPYLSFGTKANRFSTDGSMVSTGELGSEELVTDSSGRFEIIVSATPQRENGLLMDQDSSILVVRETFSDRSREKPAAMTIERVGGPAYPQPLSAARIDSSLRAAGGFVKATAAMFADWAMSFRALPNSLANVDQAVFQKAGGDPNIFYCHGYWKLQPDEALRIRVKPPQCVAWNFQLDNYWMESLDYRYLPVNINKGNVVAAADGTVTIVIAARDPGLPNFVHTAGHTEGTMALRWVLAESHPVPECDVVELDELEGKRDGAR